MKTRQKSVKRESGSATENILLRQILTRTRNRRLLTGLALCTAGLLLVLFYTPLFQNPFDLFSLVIYFGVFAGLLLIFRGLLRYDVDKEELYRVLLSEPGQVRWVYHLNFQLMPFGVHIYRITTLKIHLQNRRQLTLRASEAEVLHLMELLRTRLSQASFGYSIEKEQLFRANPDLLNNE